MKKGLESQESQGRHSVAESEDLHQLRRRRAWLEAFLETSESPLYIIGADDQVLVANRAAKELTGLEEGGQRLDFEAVCFDSRGEVMDPSNYPVARVRAGEAFVRERVTVETARGTRHLIVSARAASVDLEDGIVVQAVEVTDIETHRKRAESQALELRQVQIELSQQLRFLEGVNSVISHDLKEPLRTIQNYSHLLGRELDGKGGTATELLGFLSDAARRAQHIAADLLAYNRTGSEGSGASSPAEAIESVRAELEADLEESGGSIELVEELPHFVALKRSQLRAVFFHLLTNSLQHAGVAPNVLIGCSSQGGFARFSVSDDGEGLPEDRFEYAFEPFRRLHDRPSPAGSGVGLAICRRILELAGGSIRFEAVESGTCVVFEVPLAITAGGRESGTHEFSRAVR